jgi:hypothetical protein
MHCKPSISRDISLKAGDQRKIALRIANYGFEITG